MSEFHKGLKVKNVRTGDTGTIINIDEKVWTGRHYTTKAIVRLTNGKVLKWALSSLTVQEEAAPRALVRLKAIVSALYARETPVRRKLEKDLKDCFKGEDSPEDIKQVLHTIDVLTTSNKFLSSSKGFGCLNYSNFGALIMLLELLTSLDYCSEIDELSGLASWDSIAKFQSEISRLYVNWRHTE